MPLARHFENKDLFLGDLLGKIKVDDSQTQTQQFVLEIKIPQAKSNQLDI